MERKLPARWKEAGLFNRQCAKRLDRSVSTIGRELKRNFLKHLFTQRWVYEPIHAQRLALTSPWIIPCASRREVLVKWCWGLDSNQGSLSARVLQTRVLDRSTTPALVQ